MHLTLFQEIDMIFDGAFFIESCGLSINLCYWIYNGKKITPFCFLKQLFVSLMKFQKWKIQKQSFTDVCQKMCSEECRNIHRKTPALGYFLKKFQLY